MKENITRKMLDFIDASPTAFHVVDNIKTELLKKKFLQKKNFIKDWMIILVLCYIDMVQIIGFV